MLVSTTRTDDQTTAAIFWQAAPAALWNGVFRSLAVKHGLDVADAARLFAITNLAAADGAVACWSDKYCWNFWRPIAAIREADDAEGATRVYIDGGRTVQAFLAAGLVDEITVSIAPVLLGRGYRLFGDLDRDVLLTLRGHHSTLDYGLMRVTYDVQAR